MHKPRAVGFGSIVSVALLLMLFVFAQSSPSSTANAKDQDLIDAYRHVEVASVSDALEQLVGRRMYMSHKMQPIFPAKFAGFALTVRL